jgi:hypothetical protein
MANATQILPFSASVQGLPIKIAATSSPGTLIHTGQTSSTLVDRYTLALFNSDTVERAVTVEFGGVLAPDQNIVIAVPPRAGLTYVLQGNPLLGSGAAALTTRVFCATANVITCIGWIMRVTP